MYIKGDIVKHSFGSDRSSLLLIIEQTYIYGSNNDYKVMILSHNHSDIIGYISCFRLEKRYTTLVDSL